MPLDNGREWLAAVEWEVDAARIVAVQGTAPHVYVWVRTADGAQELRRYAVESTQLVLQEVYRDFELPCAISSDGSSACLATRVPGQPPNIVAPVRRLQTSRLGPEVTRLAESGLEKTYWRLSWAGGPLVAASIAGGWPTGVVWNWQTGAVMHLEPERLDAGFHQPAIALASGQEYAAIARRYGPVELYFLGRYQHTLTPTVFEFATAARVGWPYVESLSLSSTGDLLLMLGVEEQTAFVSACFIATAAVARERPLEERPFWVDPLTGDRQDDAEPLEGWLRAFPTELEPERVEACEVKLETKAVAGDVNADTSCFIVSSGTELTIGRFDRNARAWRLATEATDSTIQDVRLHTDRELYATVSTSGLELWRMGSPA